MNGELMVIVHRSKIICTSYTDMHICINAYTVHNELLPFFSFITNFNNASDHDGVECENSTTKMRSTLRFLKICRCFSFSETVPRMNFLIDLFGSDCI